jgi:hypothetical protein
VKHLYGTVLATTDQLLMVASTARATRLDRTMGQDIVDYLEPEGTHVLIALALLDHHAGGQPCSPFIRCKVLAKMGGAEPEVFSHVDVPIELYAELETPPEVQEAERDDVGTVFQIPKHLMPEE